MRDSFVFYASFYKALKFLSETEKSETIDAICEFALNDTPINFGRLSEKSQMVMTLIEPQLGANIKRREDGQKGGRPPKETTSESNQNHSEPEQKPMVIESEKPMVIEDKNHRLLKTETTGCVEKKPNVNVNGNVNGNENDNENDNENVKHNARGRANVFCKPTLAEVSAYCKERGNNVNAENFIDFYESKNWFVGKNKMTDWEASVRTWEKSSPQKRDKPKTVSRYLSAEELEAAIKRQNEYFEE